MVRELKVVFQITSFEQFAGIFTAMTTCAQINDKPAKTKTTSKTIGTKPTV
jgi:hypothetical protein